MSLVGKASIFRHSATTPRLDPAGACRVCLVEVEGQRRMQPGCAWPVSKDMKVTTESDRIQRHREVLYGLYQADHKVDENGVPVPSANENELRTLCEKTNVVQLESVEAPRPWPRHGREPRTSNSIQIFASYVLGALATVTKSKRSAPLPCHGVAAKPRSRRLANEGCWIPVVNCAAVALTPARPAHSSKRKLHRWSSCKPVP